MAHSLETRYALRYAYVSQGLSLPAAARFAGVPERTARNWKRQATDVGDDWDAKRIRERTSGVALDEITAQGMAAFAGCHDAIWAKLESHEGDPTEVGRAMAIMAASRKKIINAASKASPRAGKLLIVMDVVQRLARHIRERDPANVKEWSELLRSFSDRLLAETDLVWLAASQRSRRQYAVLADYARGMTTRRVADKHGVSEDQVRDICLDEEGGANLDFLLRLSG